MRIRYDEKLDQTIVSMKNSRDEQEKDVVWLKGNILSNGKKADDEDNETVFYYPYDSRVGLFIDMTHSRLSISDDKGMHVLNEELKGVPGDIEINETRHEGIMMCRTYDLNKNAYDCSKYIFENYGPFKKSRAVGTRRENGAIFDIDQNGQQTRLEFDETGLFQKGISRSPEGKETEVNSNEARHIHTETCYGYLVEKHNVKLLPSLAFKYEFHPTEKKLIYTDDWTKPCYLTLERIKEERKLKKDYRQLFYSVAFLAAVGCLIGVKRCQEEPIQSSHQPKSVLKVSEKTVQQKQIRKEKGSRQ